MATFTIRDLPEDLHARWKGVAGYFNLTMREIVIEALEKLLPTKEQVIATRNQGLVDGKDKE